MSVKDSEPKQRLNHEQLRLRKQYKDLLWQRADDLSEIREPLVEHQMQLYEEVEEMQTQNLNLYEQDLLAKKERAYWRVIGKLQDIANKEDQIEETLQGLEEGTISEERLMEIVPSPEDEEEQLSKRKQKILEERERLVKLGHDPSEIEWDLYAEFGSDPTRLATGRNRRRIKGSFHPATAAGEFFFQTTDTHGGKVKHGKMGNFYTTRSGKRIRKS